MMWTVLAVYAAGLGVMSLITLGVYAHDQRRARRGGWRVPERTLHTLELLGGWPPRPETLIEGVMAIQRIIDNDGIPPKGPNGLRRPLNVVVDPTHRVGSQPTPVTVGGA